MPVIRAASCLFLSALLAVGCGQPTAPSLSHTGGTQLEQSAASLTGFYHWTLDCTSTGTSLPYILLDAQWVWTEQGIPIDGTGRTVLCGGLNSTKSGDEARPANADGLSATVGSNVESWTLDPSRPFNAHLKATATAWVWPCNPYEVKTCTKGATTTKATLSIDS
jgi:hypothetical protein